MLNIYGVRCIAQWHQACFHTHERRAGLYCLQWKVTCSLWRQTSKTFLRLLSPHSDPNIKQSRTFLLLVTLMIMPFLNTRHVTQTYYIQTMYIFRKQAWTITGEHFDIHGICEIDTHKTCEDNAETRCNHQNVRGCTYIIWNFKMQVHFLLLTATAWSLQRPFYGRSNQHKIFSNLTNSAQTMRQIAQNRGDSIYRN